MKINIMRQLLTIIPVISLYILGVKVLSTDTSYAADRLQNQTDKFLLAAASSCEVSMPIPETNERLVLNVREEPNGDLVNTVDDGETVKLETAGDIEGLFWVKIVEPVVGYVWTEYLTNCK
ncbi:MAG: SH3 domain-containing protein [Okeania sp. SIO3I5]|uniref:SH3 domain-containing protein n=1 Tax=Okeania sp. SIO3I5 TaxID=2607805 RepID=UPI0013B9E8B1|nr:SH3 domain-containing protein [Okeania sp. SIO3I5]NEQ35459.1 SH3 domain-containing protein [Okeania sp. SIO3I5]